MTRVKSLLSSILVSCLFFVASGIVTANVLAAPRIYFDPANPSLPKGSDVQINLLIDVGDQPAFGADAIINFPAADVTVKSVTNGNFFSDFTQAQGTGRVEIHGFFSALYGSKSGNGTFATITLNSNKDSGTGAMNMVCTTGGNETEIVNASGQNILSCNSINQLSMTYTSTGSSGGNENGPTNACGGTCGSNYNCNSGLYCYTGFCRNPDCPTDITCGCKPTPTPTPKPKTKSSSTPTPSIKPTPTLVALAKATPYPTFSPSTPAPSPALNTSSTKTALIWIGIIVVAIPIILFLANKFKKKKPPIIQPPTTYPVQPPFPTTV